MSVSMEAAISEMQAQRPLVHVISNYVTLNDVVNMILAAGGTAIAADDPQEAREICALSKALYLNTGMPSERKLEAMLAAGKEANRKGIPVVLDPVGAGASDYRRHILMTILSEIHITCIRGNAAEIAALSGMHFTSRGVESAKVTESMNDMRELATRLNCILAISGTRDLVVLPDKSGHQEVADASVGTGKTTGSPLCSPILTSHTGSSMAQRITGSGCMLSGLIAAFLALYPDEPAESQAELIHQVMSHYGQAQEQAARQTCETSGGTMTFRAELINAVSNWSTRMY